MDNITHGLAGLLMADVTLQSMHPRHSRTLSPRVRRATVLLGIAAAEFPDSDLLYSGPLVQLGPLGYLLHHRGHTHTLVWATVSALLLWWLVRWWIRRGDSADRSSRAGPLLWLALAGTWSHLLLDWTNSYGVHPFWPLDHRWYYGDAVFIVEPWLWVVAIPPLLFGARSRGGRVLLALFGVGMLAASGFTGQVASAVALVLLVASLCWLGAQLVVPALARPWLGIALWMGVTATFVVSSRIARSEVTRTATARGETVLDVVLNPAPGDPTCWSTLVVSRSADRAVYRLTSGMAGVTARRTAESCLTTYTRGRAGGDVLSGLTGASATVPFAVSPQTAWRTTWSAPVAELVQLSNTRCEVAAALRFMRTPVWRTSPEGELLLADARYGTAGGFNALAYPAVASGCSITGRWIPSWTPPRMDVLRGR
jgi:inner membrane protein